MTTILDIPGTNPRNLFTELMQSISDSSTSSSINEAASKIVTAVTISSQPSTTLWKLWDAFFQAVVTSSSDHDRLLALLDALRAQSPTQAKHVSPGSDTPKISSFGTVLFTDGHQEVHVLDPNIRESEPWVSADTNLTYYGTYSMNYPTLNLSLEVKVPFKGTGEMTYLDDISPASTLFEGYAEVEATFEDEKLSGFDLVEQIYSNPPI